MSILGDLLTFVKQRLLQHPAVSFVYFGSTEVAATSKLLHLVRLCYSVKLRRNWICSTSLPGGNQVDGLPPASSVVVAVVVDVDDVIVLVVVVTWQNSTNRIT